MTQMTSRERVMAVIQRQEITGAEGEGLEIDIVNMTIDERKAFISGILKKYGDEDKE